MMDDQVGFGGRSSGEDDLIEIDLNFESMRRFRGEFSPNLSKDGLFIDTGEPLSPGSVVRFRVILPEDFIFLEGTAVVEWVRSAEAVSDGAPGMALRFVTLSPQNQELVEQLVQDHRSAGGDSFDLDVRPVPADFPTDALEGAPRPTSATEEEGYHLTVRRAGSDLEAEDEPAPEETPQEVGADWTAAADAETETDAAVAADGFEIVTTASVSDAGVVSAEREVESSRDEVEQPGAASTPDLPQPTRFEDTLEGGHEAAQDDPKVAAEGVVLEALEKGTVEPIGAAVDAVLGTTEGRMDETGDDAEDVVEKVVREAITTAAADADDEPKKPVQRAIEEAGRGRTATQGALFDGADRAEIDEVAEAPPAPPAVLPTPTEFDTGPEVIDEVEPRGFGSPAFDVSLPDLDDEPDSTPILPDEGRDDVTVPSEEDVFEAPVRRRRFWPLALVAVFLIAVIGGFLWPRFAGWLEDRPESTPDERVASVVEVTEEVAEEPIAESPGGQPGEAETVDPVALGETEEEIGDAAPTEEAVEDTGGEGLDEQAEEVAAEIDAAPAEGAAGTEPVPPPAAVDLPRADTVTAIEIVTDPRGTKVRVRANGSLADGVISMESLRAPPRVLVRVRGIVNRYRPYTIDAGTAEVAQARIGHHEERRPPELWVVVDLTGADVALGGVDIRGDVAEFVLARP
jgi:uncharacterized protein (TIGR02266 family)